MDKTGAILEDTKNRNAPLPDGLWKYYQEWHQVLFLHWKIDATVLQPLLPAGLEVDTLDGSAWISLVPCSVRKMKLRKFPRLPFFPAFDEISLRTYVAKDNVPGIYTFSVEANQLSAILISKILTGVSYTTSRINRSWHAINAINASTNNILDVRYSVKSAIYNKTSLDQWLTQRYSIYQFTGGRLYQFDIHHKEWKLKVPFLGYSRIAYNVNSVALPDRAPDYLHFAKKIKVLVWSRKDITTIQ